MPRLRAKKTEVATSASSGILSTVRENPWIISTVVLGVLFLITLFIATTVGPSASSSVSQDVASQKVLDFLKTRVTGDVKVDSIVQEKGLYKLSVTYQGDTIPVYATLDGTSIVADLIPIDGSAPSSAPGAQPSKPSTVTIDSEKLKGAPVKGQASAPVTIVEFSDFQCPFCERAYSDAVKQIDEQYIKTGKVKLIYMNFPLSFHPEAQKAAEAALCFRKVKGGSDAEYYKFHDKLFENQGSLSLDNYKAWAKAMGANEAQFDSCLTSGEFASVIQAQEAYGQSIGVSGTPAFFINGIEVTGAQPFSAFKQVIDAELAK